MAAEFSKGEYVIYGKTGLCEITDITEMALIKNERDKYYVLRPSRDSGTKVYVPYNSDALRSKMSRVMTKEETDKLIDSLKGNEIKWTDDRIIRSERFESAVATNDRASILMVIECIAKKKSEREKEGKKLWSTDEALLKSLTEVIKEEFSFSLGIAPSEVMGYIKNRLKND